MISEPMLRSTQTVHLSSSNELPLEPRHLVVPSNASKMISEPLVRLAQSVHLSCSNTNTVSKRKEAGFHMTHVTKEFHRMRPKRFRAYGTFDANRAPILRQD